MFLHRRTKSNLESNEIEHLLREQLEARTKTAALSKGRQNYFQGEIKNRQFKLVRNASFLTTFNPKVVVIGKIQQEIDHTIIDLRVRPDFAVLAVLLFLSLLVLMDAASPLISSPGRGEQPFISYLLQPCIAIGAILFAFSFVMVRFNSEAEKVIKYLDELFVSQSLLQ